MQADFPNHFDGRECVDAVDLGEVHAGDATQMAMGVEGRGVRPG